MELLFSGAVVHNGMSCQYLSSKHKNNNNNNNNKNVTKNEETMKVQQSW
jgi:hypothetical protein